MKTILFLQHYKLEHPYDSWVNITYKESVGLSQGLISPSINTDIDKVYNELYSHSELSKYEIIISSPVIRAIQTAEFLQKKISKDIRIIINNNLSEVTWDLSRYLDEQEYNKAKEVGRYNIGDRRIIDFINNSSITNLDTIDTRIKQLRNDLIQLPYSNIACITHSFLMKVIYLYLVENKELATITVADFKKKFPISYLNGFEVDLSK